VQKKSARLLFRPSASLRFSTDAGAAELTCLRQVQRRTFPDIHVGVRH
jgi:hypothetical protein